MGYYYLHLHHLHNKKHFLNYDYLLLGNKRTPDGRFNCSEWLGHSLLEAKVAGQLAFLSRLDTNKATKLRNAS